MTKCFGGKVFKRLGSREGKFTGDPVSLNDAAQFITSLDAAGQRIPYVISINTTAFAQFGDVTRRTIPLTSEALTALLQLPGPQQQHHLQHLQQQHLQQSSYQQMHQPSNRL